MKDTRKLSLVYFVISLVMMLMVCFGCEANSLEIDYIHTINGYEVYYSNEIQSLNDLERVADYLINAGHDHFVVQSDLGIIEVENGEVTYLTK